MADDKYQRLRLWIAREAVTPGEAESIVSLLSQIKDWDRLVRESREGFRERERRKVYKANYRARIRQQPADLKLTEWLNTLEHFRGRCAYCQDTFSYEHLEHFFPISGYSVGTTAYNCVPSCIACNRYKEAKPLEHWLDQQRLFEDDFVRHIIRVHDYLKAVAPKAQIARLPFRMNIDQTKGFSLETSE